MPTLTPDFYSYRWEPLTQANVEADNRFVSVRWDDGSNLRLFDHWLWENAVETGGFDPATREGLIDPSQHRRPQQPSIAAAKVDSDGMLQIQWATKSNQTIVANYHPGWLKHFADGKHRHDQWLPEPSPWTTATLPEPPTIDGTNALTDPTVLTTWVNELIRHGLARLTNIDTSDQSVLRVARRIGVVRDTNFGPTWDVKTDVEMAGHDQTNSTANTNLRLGPHTDLPTRETPPGFQFLHCLANETSGGHSTMADGMALVEHLENEHPEHFEALTTLNWVFFNRGPNIDHRWSGPIIDKGVAASPLTLRAFYPVRAFPDMDPSDIPRAYEALALFSELAASDMFQMNYPFTAGDLVGFDNRRILHGRDAFDSGGRRHLRGVYIDHDEVRSFARVANRRNQTPKP